MLWDYVKYSVPHLTLNCFIYLFISAWTHRFLSYWMGYNLLLTCFTFMQEISQIQSFRASLRWLLYPLICPYESSIISYCLILKFTCSSLGELIFRNPDLWPRSVHCFWSITALSPSQCREMKTVCLSIYLYIYTYTHAQTHLFYFYVCILGFMSPSLHLQLLSNTTVFILFFYPFNICNYLSPTTLNIYTYLIKPSQYNLSPLSLPPPPNSLVFIPLRVWHPSPSHHHNPQVDALFTLLRPSAPLWSTMTSHLLPMNAAAFFGFTWWLLDLIV